MRAQAGPWGLPPLSWEQVSIGLAVLVAGAVLSWLVRRAMERTLRWRGRSPSASTVFARLAQGLVILVAVAATLTIIFPSVRPVDALGGIGIISIAAGIAFQTVLGNLFAGIVILAQDRYRVGDQIAVKDVRGTIDRMSLSMTRVRTFDGRSVIVPNAIMHADIVVLQTGYERVRTSVLVSLDETTDLSRAVRSAVEAMRGQPGVADDPAPEALLSAVGSGSVELELRFWSGARQLETREAQHAVIKAVVERFRQDGVASAAQLVVVEPGPRLRSTLDTLRAEP